MSTRVENNATADAQKKDFLSYSTSEDSMFQANFGYHRQYRPRYHYQHTPREQSRARPRINNYIQPNFLHSQRAGSDNMGYYRPHVYHSGPRYPRYHVPWDGYIKNSQSSYRYGDAKTTNSAIIQSSNVTLPSMPQTSALQFRMSQPGQEQASMMKSGQAQPSTVEPGSVVKVKPVITQPSMSHPNNPQYSFTSLPHSRIEQVSSAHPQTSTAQLGSQKFSKTQPRQLPCSMELPQTRTLPPNRTQNSIASVGQISTAQPRMMKAKLTQILTPQLGMKQSTMEQTQPRESSQYSSITQPTVSNITKTTHLSTQLSPSRPIFHQTSTEYRRSPPKARHKIKESDMIQTSMAHPSNIQSSTLPAEQKAVDPRNVERVLTTRQEVSVSQHGTFMKTSGEPRTCNTQPKITTAMSQPCRVQNSMFRPSMTTISMKQSTIVQTSIPMVPTSPRRTKTLIEAGKKERSMAQQNSVAQPKVEQLTAKGELVTKAESIGVKPREGSESFLVQYPAAINRSYDKRWKSAMASNGDHNRFKLNVSQRHQPYPEVTNTVVKRRNDDRYYTKRVTDGNRRFENAKRNRWDLKEKDMEKSLTYENTMCNNVSQYDCKVKVDHNKETSQSGHNHTKRSGYLQTETNIEVKGENNNHYKYSNSLQTFKDREFPVGQLNNTHENTKKTTTNEVFSNSRRSNSNSCLCSNSLEKMENCEIIEENSPYDEDSRDAVEEVDDELDSKDADELLMSMSNRSIKINRLLEEQKRLMARLHVPAKLRY